jgi:hypothetical protein
MYTHTHTHTYTQTTHAHTHTHTHTHTHAHTHTHTHYCRLAKPLRAGKTPMVCKSSRVREVKDQLRSEVVAKHTAWGRGRGQ